MGPPRRGVLQRKVFERGHCMLFKNSFSVASSHDLFPPGSVSVSPPSMHIQRERQRDIYVDVYGVRDWTRNALTKATKSGYVGGWGGGGWHIYIYILCTYAQKPQTLKSYTLLECYHGLIREAAVDPRM